MSRRSTTLRTSFITTVATTVASLAAATVAGCGLDVRFSDSHHDACAFGESGCNDPCPTEPPDASSFCAQDGQICDYTASETCGIAMSCGDGHWNDITPSCNPPPPDPTCPDALPTGGTSCTPKWGQHSYRCEGYIDPLCGVPIGATCNEQNQWEVDGIRCNPPPPELCGDNQTYESCTAVPWCRWLVPGCDEPALPFAGCFAMDDCLMTGCDLGEQCSEVVYDPCWNLNCDSCGAITNVCLTLTD